MATPIDVLFITRCRPYRETGDPRVHEPLRLRIDGQVAALHLLRALARGQSVSQATTALTRQRVSAGNLPVLTSIYLSEYLRKRGLAFEEIECLESGQDALREKLARGVRLIALCTTWLSGLEGAEEIREAAALLRTLAPGVPLIAGGVGVRKGMRARKILDDGQLAGVTAEELARRYVLIDAQLDRNLDAMVVSEGGEATLVAIVERLKAGQDFRDLPNLAIPSADGYRFTPAVPENIDVDQEVIDWRHHVGTLGGYGAIIRTGVGCPFSCEFCDFAGLYRMRLRSMDSLMGELRSLAAATPAPRRVFFTDDNVGLNRRHLITLCNAIIKEKLDVSWRGFLRADVIDAETAALLRESGCRECFLGIESGDGQILQNMNKRLDPDQALRGIQALDAVGINTMCSFVVGFPGECDATIQNTADFISQIPSGAHANAVHRYYLFRFEVVPLCRAASDAKRAQRKLTGIGENWSHATMDADGAREAMRQIFLKVRGPSHVYLELPPAEWSAPACRRVLEARDTLQRARLQTPGTDGLDALLETVHAAEREAGLITTA